MSSSYGLALKYLSLTEYIIYNTLDDRNSVFRLLSLTKEE